MTELTEVRLTLPEASFVSGLTVRDINREIDAGIISVGGARRERKVRGVDLFYLFAVKEVRARLDPGLRRDMRKVIAAAAAAHRPEARLHQFLFPIDAIRQHLVGPFEALERSKHEQLEVRADILAGETVIKGTRIAARHVADLLKHGAAREEIRDDLELTDTQIDAAVVFDRTTPRRGRPAARGDRKADVCGGGAAVRSGG